MSEDGEREEEDRTHHRGESDILTKLTSLALDLDTVVQELLECRTVKDTVTRGTGVVNDELVLSSSSLSGGGLGLHREEEEEKPSVSLLRR